MAKAKNENESVEDAIEIKLSILECLKFKELLPAEGSMLTLILSRDIQIKTSLTQSDFKIFNITEVPGTRALKWDEVADVIPIKFTEAEIGLLQRQVMELDKGDKIKMELLNLCMKIKDCK